MSFVRTYVLCLLVFINPLNINRALLVPRHSLVTFLFFLKNHCIVLRPRLFQLAFGASLLKLRANAPSIKPLFELPPRGEVENTSHNPSRNLISRPQLAPHWVTDYDLLIQHTALVLNPLIQYGFHLIIIMNKVNVAFYGS